MSVATSEILMSKKIKIILFVFLAVLVFLIVKGIQFRTTKVENQALENLNNLKIVYSTNNGSLPPPYHKEYELTITTNESGKITGEIKASDYKSVLETKSVAVSEEQLKKLIELYKNVNPKEDESITSGCTGGSPKSVKISQGEKVLLETSAYNCGGKSSNESLADFSAEADKILSNK